MFFLILFTCTISLSQGAPFLSWFTSNSYNSYLPESAQDFINETLEEGKDVVYDIYDGVNYLPESAKTFLNKSLEEGKDVVYDIYDDVKEEIIDKTASHVDSFTNVLGGFFDKYQNIKDSLTGIAMEDALDDDELTDWNNEQGLDKLKEKMKDLEEQVEIDMEKDESITDEVEQLIQQFLTSTREMVAELGDGEEFFWSKMKQLEVEFYKVKVALVDASGDLKTEVSELFKTLKKVDLNKIGAVEDQGQEQETPREFK